MPETSKVSMDLLLYLYGLYKTNLTLFEAIDLFFSPPTDLKSTFYGGREPSCELKKDFLEICQTSDELRRCLKYLKDEGFIDYKKYHQDEWMVCYKDFEFNLTGEKIIKGVNDENYRKDFSDKFHITVNDFSDKFHITVNVTLESLIKNELGGLNLSLLNLKDLLGML